MRTNEITINTLLEACEVLESAGYKVKRGKKSRRVQLVMHESLYNLAKDKIKDQTDPATGNHLSFNQYIEDLIREDLRH